MSLYEEASTTTMSNTNNNMRQLSYNNNNSPSTNYSNNPNGTQHNNTPVMTSPTDGSSIDVVKRKRGRPRKYPADVSVSPLPPPGSTAAAGDGGYSSPAGMSNSGKKRGRPPMSLNKQHHPAASGTSVCFEQINKIMSLYEEASTTTMSNTNNNMRQLSYNNNSPSTNYSNNPNGTQHNYTPVMTLPTDGSSIDVVKRKRGRPRKYPADVSVSPLPPPGSTAAAGDGGYSSPVGMSNSGKKRGRPPMSLNKQHHPAASEMETQRLTEYEQRRLENIKRNVEMLGSFKIKSKLADLTAVIKPHRVKTNISHNVKPKIPTVACRSLRAQGKVPDSTGLKDKFRKSKDSKPPKTFKSQLQELEPVSMTDANTCSKSDQMLISQLKNSDVHGRVKASIDLDSMNLAPKNIANNVLPGVIMSIKFFPSTYMRMVVAGNKWGTIAFWNVDSEKEDGDGIYKYHTNPGLVSAILIQPFSMNKITTSCYGGQIRSLDIEKEILALSYSTAKPITSMSQQPGDVNSLYFGEGEGVVRQWDQRSRKSILSWDIHESIVNTIDFNPENTNIMATSSSDNTACIWDLRKLSKSKPEFVKLIVHKRVVYSAYFSPSGNFLATTSIDDKIGVLSGKNYDEEFMINHNNQTGRYIPSLKGIWGWDDSYLFVGNKKKGVDVISAYTKTLVTTLESPHMSAIPCRFDAHPFIPGMLAGAAGGGQVYVWTS